ncbi:MAG: phosphoglycerate dehydrogenase [Bacillota bacterium]
MQPKILITPKSFGNFKSKAYPLLEAKGYQIIENNLGRTLTAQEIINFAAKDVVGIIVGVDPLTSLVLENCRDLRAISKYGAGMDNIDLVKAKELGIKVKNAAGTNKISVAELTIGLIFTLARRISIAAYTVKNGGWDRQIGFELTAKKLGLIGGGQVGKEVALRARGLQMSVSIYDPHFNDQEFLAKYQITRVDHVNDIFREADIVSLHLPLTAETKSLINSESLKLFKPTAILINTSRGELVDEEALYTALSQQKIAGAAQDVFSSEPPAKDEKLLKLENFILTPHIGAFTGEAVEKMVMVSTQNLLDMLE